MTTAKRPVGEKWMAADTHVELCTRRARSSRWPQARLGDVVRLRRGHDLPKRVRVAGSYPIVSSSGITDSHAKAKVQGPGVIIGRYGTLGKVHFVNGDYWPLNTTLYVEDFKGNVPRYVGYLLETIDVSPFADKAAVPGLNRNHLHESEIPFAADPGSQRAIAHVLGTLDDKIELNRRMNETLEATAMALFKSWFVDFEPVRAKMEGRDPRLPESIANLFPDALDDQGRPSGWMWQRLDRLFDVSIGRTPPRKERHHFVQGGMGETWLSIKTMGAIQTFATASDEDLTPCAVERFRVPLIPAGTVMVSFKLTVGRVAIAARTMYSNEAIAHLRARTDTPVATAFTYCYMKEFDYDTLGSTSSIATAVNSKSIKAIEMLVPQAATHAAFEAVAQPLFERILQVTRQTEALKAIRDALLPKLISGEIRASQAETAVEGVTESAYA